MPHGIREEHLEDICANCRKYPGNDFHTEKHNGKFYDIAKCENCGYEIIKPKKEVKFVEQWEVFHKVQ
ncbi:MAG TPA: hypothetical protein V6C58_10680 [Allocoleopsis sp.]